MTTKQKEKLEHDLGWPTYRTRGVTLGEVLEMEMVLRLGIQFRGPHKYRLWIYMQGVVQAMDRAEQRHLLESKKKLDVLAMEILLTHRE